MIKRAFYHCIPAKPDLSSYHLFLIPEKNAHWKNECELKKKNKPF